MTVEADRGVRLRPVTEADREALFQLESDRAGSQMIAFLPRTPGDRAAFDAHFTRVTGDTATLLWVIESDGAFAGYGVSFLMDGERQVGYWIVRELWGRGIATAALRAMVAEIAHRPLWGSTAGDNLGSQRVLQNVGFRYLHSVRTHAPARGTEVEERVYRLD